MSPITARPRPLHALLLAAAGLLLAGLLGAPAGAQVYPPEPEITVGTPGAVITIRGTDWGPGTVVEVVYRNGAAAATTAATVADDGTFTAELQLPDDAPLGETALSVSGTGTDGEPRDQQPRILVQADTGGGAGTVNVSGDAPADPTPTDRLSATGTNLGIGLAALALLTAGGTALLAARRRRNAF